jgi:hypothetical protein
MGIKGVVDPAAPARVKIKADFFPTLANHVAHLRLLFGVGAVLFGQVFAQVLAAWTHLWVEFEGLKAQFNRHLAFQALQRLLQGTQAHRAPRACNVGDEINGQWGSHGSSILVAKGVIIVEIWCRMVGLQSAMANALATA